MLLLLQENGLIIYQIILKSKNARMRGLPMGTAFHTLLQDILYEVAEKHADNMAIEWRDQRLSYAQLEAASNHIANCLRSAGFEKGAIIGVVIEHPIELITSLIGILKAGCAFATFDPMYPEQRLQLMAEEIAPRCFLLEEAFIARIRSLGGRAAQVPFFLVDEVPAVPATSESLVYLKQQTVHTALLHTPVSRTPDDLCYIYFTSGSTGKPKAIAGRLGGLSHFIAWERKTFQVTETFRVSQIIPPAFDPFLRDVFVPLCSGATLCVPDSRETALDPQQLMHWIEERQITLMHCVPTLFRAMANEQSHPEYFTALKYLLIAGEPLFGADVKKWMDIYGDRVQLVNL